MVITVLILAFLLLPVHPVPWQVEFPLLLYHSPAHECFMAPYCLLSILISLLSLQYSPYPNSIIFIRFSPMITHLSGVYRLASTIPCVSKTHPPLCCWSLRRREWYVLELARRRGRLRSIFASVSGFCSPSTGQGECCFFVEEPDILGSVTMLASFLLQP